MQNEQTRLQRLDSQDDKPRPYRCDECELAFTRKDNLRRHKRVKHTGDNHAEGEKLHHCGECEKSFKEKANFKSPCFGRSQRCGEGPPVFTVQENLH